VNIGKIKDEGRRHSWLIAFVLVVCFGYMIGKDMAMRDNVRDAAAADKRAS
jgi:hypothetical protein